MRRVMLGAFEIVFLIAAYWTYVSAKTIFHYQDISRPFANALHVISLERLMGLFREAALQQWFLQHSHWVIVLSDWTYAYGFWAAIGLVAAGLYKFKPEKYQDYRNIMLISFMFAIVIFALFPLTPPRLMGGLGFTDTMAQFGPKSYFSSGEVLGYNRYAAMPSMHYGWSILVMAACLEFKSRWVKAAGFCFPLIIFFAIVVTGNHYILDGVIALPIIAISGYLYGRMKLNWRRMLSR